MISCLAVLEVPLHKLLLFFRFQYFALCGDGVMGLVAIGVLRGLRGCRKTTIPPGIVVPLGRAEVQIEYAIWRRVASP